MACAQVNVWGYSTTAFLAPMSRYGTPGAGPAAAAREFKTMVKARASRGAARCARMRSALR